MFIKSPLNYTGGKFKLLDKICPLFPSNIDTFVDLFGGGFNVGINIDANKIIYNDTMRELVLLLQMFKETKIDETLDYFSNLIEAYSLSKENRDGYLKLRNDYNKQQYKNYFILYMLICYSFNNQIRFNKKGEYNMPFGLNRSSFNPSLKKKFIAFVQALQQKNVVFSNIDFSQLDINGLTENDLIYCDPPYLNSVATYNENSSWNESRDLQLLNFLDILNTKNIKFALSNNFDYKNTNLISWSKKYNVHLLDYNYNNCNYHKKNKLDNKEVLITNY